MVLDALALICQNQRGDYFDLEEWGRVYRYPTVSFPHSARTGAEMRMYWMRDAVHTNQWWGVLSVSVSRAQKITIIKKGVYAHIVLGRTKGDTTRSE